MAPLGQNKQVSPGDSQAAVSASNLLDSHFVCPFCGSINETAEGACPRCTMENTPAGRKATKSRIGPWYVLQRRNPAAPGMKFETLLAFVKKGRIKPQSIVRGPTTHQLWRFAAHVKGLSREFGSCYSCGGSVAPDAQVCPQCNRLQDPPANPDVFLEMPGTPGIAAPAPITPVYLEVRGPTEPPTPEAGKSLSAAAARAADEEEANAAESPEAGDIDLIVPAIEPDPPPAAAPTEEEPRNHELVIPRLGPAPLFAPLPGAPSSGGGDNGKSASAGRVEAPPLPEPGRDIDWRERSSAEDEPEGSSHPDEPAYRERLPAVARLPGRDGGPEPIPALRPPPRVIAQRSRAGLEIAIFLLIIGVAVVSGLLYVDPELRQQATAWLARQGWIASRDTRETTGLPHHKGPDLAPMAATMPAAPQDEVRPEPSARLPRLENRLVSDVPLISPHIASAPSEPTTGPAHSATAHEAPAETLPKESPSAPTPEDDNPAALSDAAAFNRAKLLWRRALDADAAGDYRKEVQLYEQIKKLPRETWPQPLELYLKFARDNANAHK